MQRFREWRESLRAKSEAESAAALVAGRTGRPVIDTSSVSSDGTVTNKREYLTQDQPHKRHNSGEFNTAKGSKGQGSSSAGGAGPPPSNGVVNLSFAELDRLRRERHGIFVSLLSDPETFAQFLRFLPPTQQHELLFICEINQLLERSTQWDEAEIFMQAIKIANIFLRNADSSSGPPTASDGSDSSDPDQSVLQVQSIQPATRRHLQACIPLTLPAHLLPAGASPPPPASGPDAKPAPYQTKTDTKSILMLLEVARDQVEEGISKRSLQRFLDALNNPGARSQAAQSLDEPTLALQSEYTFDDCLAAVAGPQEADLGYVFRAFLLYLMQEKRHRVLCFWAEVQRALASVQDPELDPTTSDAQPPAALHPSASNEDVHQEKKKNKAAADAEEPRSAPPLDSSSSRPVDSSSSSSSRRSLSALLTLYIQLEDAYHAFYPDAPRAQIDEMLVDQQHQHQEQEQEQTHEGKPVDLLSSSSSTTPTPTASADFSSPLLSSPAALQADIDAHATPGDLARLQSLIREMISRLRPICVKMDKLLRYTFWPQFCKSEDYHRLGKIKRPPPAAAAWIAANPPTVLPGGGVVSRSDRRASGSGSRRESADNSASTAAASAPPPALLVPPTPSAASSATGPPPSSKAAASSSSSSSSSARLRHALVSSLKQQKVTREMLVLECASQEEQREREARKRRAEGAGGVIKGERPTSGTTTISKKATGATTSAAPVAACHPRLLEYVCVLRSTPTFPPRPSSQAKLPAGGASVHSVGGGAGGYIGGPPLPPRTPAVLAAVAKARSPMPPTPRAAAAGSIGGAHVPATSIGESTSPALKEPPSTQRGSQSLSLLYRYPLADHASSQLPHHLIDLAFPLLPPAAATASSVGAESTAAADPLCTCAHGAPGQLVCLKDTTKVDSDGSDTASSSSSSSSTSASASGASSRSNSNAAIETDWYGFPITNASAAAASRGRAGSTAGSTNGGGGSSSANSSSNRLFNLVCTQEDGSFLHGCVLQITQLETIDERWDEVVTVVTPRAGSGGGGIGGGGGWTGTATGRGDEELLMVPGLGIGADVLLRERRKSTEKKREHGGAGGFLPPPTDAALAGAGPVGRRASLTGLPGGASSAPLSVSTGGPLSGGAPVTPSSASQKLSALFDGFAKDVRHLVDRVKSEDHTAGSSAAAAVASSPAAPGATAISVTAPSDPSLLPLHVTPTPTPSPSPSVSPATAGTSAVVASPHSGFYALSTLSAESTGAGSAAGSVGGLAGVAGAAAAAAVADSATPARAKHRSGTRTTQVVHHHHRVFRVQTQYAVVLLTTHPLFNLLRSALTNLLQSARGTLGAEANPISDFDRSALVATFPRFSSGSAGVAGGLQGAISDLFHCPSFLSLLTYTRVPAHALDLFGLAATLGQPSYLGVPPVDFHFDLLFRCLHPRRLLLVLECLICERRVLLVSASNSMLTLAGQSLLALLYPFHWRYLYVPILPYSLFKYLACPTPFLIGIHACFRRKARELTERDVVTVDLDHDEVFMPPIDTGRASGPTTTTTTTSSTATTTATDASFHLPSTVREQLLAHAARLFQSDVGNLDTDGGSIDEAAPMGDGSSILTGGVSHRGHSFASLPHLLQPERPAVDEEARKLLDTYANAEAPRLTATSASLITKTPSSSSSSSSSSSGHQPPPPLSVSERSTERERSLPQSMVSGDATFGSPSASASWAAKDPPAAEETDDAATAGPLPDVFSPTAASSAVSPLPFPSFPAAGAVGPPSSASLRSLLLQLEFVKIWSHLLKQFRQYAILLPSAPPSNPADPAAANSGSGGDGGILLFDSPAFLATKPEHYQPFLTTLLNTSYFPAFLHERTGPGGLEPVQRDAFDRYEASLSGARVQVWQAAYAYQRAADQAAAVAAATGAPIPAAFTPTRRAELAEWLRLYRMSGIDPSLHHVEYLEGWNVDSHMTLSQIQRLPREWFAAEGEPTTAEVPTAATAAAVGVESRASIPRDDDAGATSTPSTAVEPTPAADPPTTDPEEKPARSRATSLRIDAASSQQQQQQQQLSQSTLAEAVDSELTRRFSVGTPVKMAENLLLASSSSSAHTSPASTPRPSSRGDVPLSSVVAPSPPVPVSSSVASASGGASPSLTPSGTPRSKSTLYRTRRPSNRSRSASNSRTSSPIRAALVGASAAAAVIPTGPNGGSPRSSGLAIISSPIGGEAAAGAWLVEPDQPPADLQHSPRPPMHPVYQESTHVAAAAAAGGEEEQDASSAPAEEELP